MKHKHLVTLVVAALLAVGAMGAVTPRSFAQAPVSPGTGADVQYQPAGEANDGQEAASNEAEVEGNDGPDAAPTGTPAVTAADAQKTAEAYLNAGPASKVQLDDENGKLVYSVEIGTTDVKVDAMTGAVLGKD